MRMLQTETIHLLEHVLNEFMAEGRAFFMLEATNEVKARGLKTTPPSGFGKHSDMRDYGTDHVMNTWGSTGYCRTQIPTGNGGDAWLYHPMSMTFGEILTHHGRTVRALPPNEVVLRAQDAYVHTADDGVLARLGRHVLKLLGRG